MGDLRFEELVQVPPGLAAGSPPARPPQPPGRASGPWQLLRPGWRQCRGLRMRSLSGAATRFRRAHFLVTPPEAWLAGSWPASWRILCLHLIVSKSLGKQEGIGLKERDPGLFGRLPSRAGSADCSNKSPLASRGHFLLGVETGLGGRGADRARPSLVPGAGAGAWLPCCCDKQLRADPGVSMPRLGVGRASPGPPFFPSPPQSLAWCTRHPLRNSQAQQRPKSHVSLSLSGTGL